MNERIQELAERAEKAEAALRKQTKQIGVACEKHDLIHALACGYCLREAEACLRDAEAALAKSLREIGKMQANGVTWYSGNPHSFPVGTKFYVLATDKGADHE